MKNGLGTASLVLGIIAIPGCIAYPYFFYVLAVLAIVFGSIGLSRSRRGLATNGTASGWGLGLGIAAFIIGLVNIPSIT